MLRRPTNAFRGEQSKQTTCNTAVLYLHLPVMRCVTWSHQVQSVTIAATHQDEVQTITTAAPAIVGVQLMTTSADQGTTVAGNFALQFPEIQTLTLSASAKVTTGTFSLTYTSMSADGSGSLDSAVEITTCLDWNADAEAVSNCCCCRC